MDPRKALRAQSKLQKITFESKVQFIINHLLQRIFRFPNVLLNLPFPSYLPKQPIISINTLHPSFKDYPTPQQKYFKNPLKKQISHRNCPIFRKPIIYCSTQKSIQITIWPKVSKLSIKKYLWTKYSKLKGLVVEFINFIARVEWKVIRKVCCYWLCHRFFNFPAFYTNEEEKNLTNKQHNFSIFFSVNFPN